MSSVVYFILCVDRVKIGRTENVAKRIKGLQTGAPDTLRLLGSMSGGPAEEQALHERFKHLRAVGEWFRAEPELLAFVASMTGKAVHHDALDMSTMTLAQFKAIQHRPTHRRFARLSIGPDVRHAMSDWEIMNLGAPATTPGDLWALGDEFMRMRERFEREAS